LSVYYPTHSQGGSQSGKPSKINRGPEP
jgi:hypothetical protein